MKDIGKSIKRVDGHEKVTGETKYVTDLTVAEMVYAVPVFSSIPFGRITKIDLKNTGTIAGFLGFIGAEHVVGENQVGVISDDQPLFADKIVRFVGDTIGLVIAKTESAARKITAAVKIEYEKFQPFFSIDDSRDAETDFIHDNNIACQHQVVRGDIESGFKQADLIVESTFQTPYQEHYYLEPQGCIAVPMDNGGMYIMGSLQCPFYVQKAVAKALGFSLSKVEVEQTPIGGAFGGKEDIPSEVCARAAVAAHQLKLPVKMIYSRRDDMQMTSKRHPFQMNYKVGVSDNGKLIAARIVLEENAGAYATLSSVVSYRAAMQAMGPYVIPNIIVESKSYYTNLPPTGAFRGFGSPQVAFGHERVMDIIAEKLNLDPIELRLKNVLRVNDITMTGHKLKASVGVEETIFKAKSQSRWDEFRAKKNGDNSGRFREGIGIGVAHYGNCLGAAGWFMDGAGAKIKIHRDGSVTVSFGLVEMGQGALTAVTQMTAQALGISPTRITVSPTNTQFVPDSGPSVASRNVVMTGNAIKDAAQKLLPTMKDAAAERLKCDENDIVIENDCVENCVSHEVIDFAELTDYMYCTNRSLEEMGWWHVPSLNYEPKLGVGEAYFSYSFMTHIAKVKVDTLTGQIAVDKIWAAHDVGKAINPSGLEAQVEGGIAQGIGWALTENFQINNGNVETANLSTYLIPTAVDVSEVETIIVEDPEPEGPWGAKGIGEPALIPTAAAITNAVADATGNFFNKLPITPEVILKTIKNKMDKIK